MSQNIMAIRLPTRDSPNAIELSDEDDLNENKTSFLSNGSIPSREDEMESFTSNDSHKIDGKDYLWVIPNEENRYNLSRSQRGNSNTSLNTNLTPGSGYLFKSQEAKRIQELSQRLNSPTLTTYNMYHGNSSSGVNFGQHKNDVKYESEVYFRYNDTVARIVYDFNSRPDLVVGLQAYARRYLAKKRLNRRKLQEEAVLIIQSNIDLHFDPWINLFKVIRPLLVHHQNDRYISRLKGNITILKNTIKSLKAENTEFSDHLSQLTQKLMRAHGSNNKVHVVQQNLNELNQELMSHTNNFSKILDKNTRLIEDGSLNEFPFIVTNDDSENDLILEETTFPSGSDTYSGSQEVGGDSGIILRKKKCNSSIMNQKDPFVKENRAASLDKARDDADFYRMQVELLREEAECQHQSANNHYEEKIIVLSSRIEQLQNQLNEEMNKGDKLKKELDEALHVAAERRLCEKTLQSVVESLCKQLEEYRDLSKEQSDDPNGKELIERDTLRKLRFCREYIEGLRSYFAANTRQLQNSIFAPGAEFDLFEDRFLANITEANCNNQQSVPHHEGKNRPKNLPDSIFQNSPIISMLSPMAMNDFTTQKKNEEEIIDLTKRLELEIEEKETLERELNSLRNRITAMKRENNHLLEDHQEEIDEIRNKNQRKINELEELLEEELRLRQNAENSLKNLERQLISMRRASEYSELEHVNDERQEVERRLREDVIYYKNSLDRVQDEFDEYKTLHNTQRYKEEIEEKDKQIQALTHEKAQLLTNYDIASIKLQTTNNLLEKNENQLRQITKERDKLMSRMAQLENERDQAFKESALLAGKVDADKESVNARINEIRDLRRERDNTQRELNEARNELTEIKFNSSAESQTLMAKLKEGEKHLKQMKDYFEKLIENKNYEINSLQTDSQHLLTSEKNLKAANRKLKREFDELNEQNLRNCKKINELERNYKDLVEERDRAKSDLTAARETADYLRASRTRLDEEVNSSINDSEGIQYRRLFSRTPTIASPEGYGSLLKRKSMGNTLLSLDNDLPTPVPHNVKPF